MGDKEGTFPFPPGLGAPWGDESPSIKKGGGGQLRTRAVQVSRQSTGSGLVALKWGGIAEQAAGQASVNLEMRAGLAGHALPGAGQRDGLIWAAVREGGPQEVRVFPRP